VHQTVRRLVPLRAHRRLRLRLFRGGEILLRDWTPERRDLDRLGAETDVRQPEASADDPAVPEQLLDLIGMRRRADVEILGTTAEEQVTDAAADQIRDVVALIETIEDLQRIGVDLLPRNRMRLPRDDDRLTHRKPMVT
jgi:hypothetical protein